MSQKCKTKSSRVPTGAGRIGDKTITEGHNGNKGIFRKISFSFRGTGKEARRLELGKKRGWERCGDQNEDERKNKENSPKTNKKKGYYMGLRKKEKERESQKGDEKKKKES